jgi:hypothetical protein
VPHEIHDSTGASVQGSITSLISGLGGVPTRWVAVGIGNSPFIAFSDGTEMSVYDFIKAQAPDGGLNGEPIYLPEIDKASVSNGSILFSGSIFTSYSPTSFPAVLNGLSWSGAYVAVVPLPEKGTHSPLDVNSDWKVTPVDALIVINAINEPHSAQTQFAALLVDVNEDGVLSPLDALIVINFLNGPNSESNLPISGSAEGESTGSTTDPGLILYSENDAFPSVTTGRRK